MNPASHILKPLLFSAGRSALIWLLDDGRLVRVEARERAGQWWVTADPLRAGDLQQSDMDALTRPPYELERWLGEASVAMRVEDLVVALDELPRLRWLAQALRWPDWCSGLNGEYVLAEDLEPLAVQRVKGRGYILDRDLLEILGYNRSHLADARGISGDELDAARADGTFVRCLGLWMTAVDALPRLMPQAATTATRRLRIATTLVAIGHAWTSSKPSAPSGAARTELEQRTEHDEPGEPARPLLVDDRPLPVRVVEGLEYMWLPAAIAWLQYVSHPWRALRVSHKTRRDLEASAHLIGEVKRGECWVELEALMEMLPRRSSAPGRERRRAQLEDAIAERLSAQASDEDDIEECDLSTEDALEDDQVVPMEVIETVPPRPLRQQAGKPASRQVVMPASQDAIMPAVQGIRDATAEIAALIGELRHRHPDTANQDAGIERRLASVEQQVAMNTRRIALICETLRSLSAV